jgi:hypothetical protein
MIGELDYTDWLTEWDRRLWAGKPLLGGDHSRVFYFTVSCPAHRSTIPSHSAYMVIARRTQFVNGSTRRLTDPPALEVVRHASRQAPERLQFTGRRIEQPVLEMLSHRGRGRAARP